MKFLNKVRRLDDLGRIVIPREIRKTLEFEEGDALEMWIDKDNNLILKKYNPSEIENN